MSLIKNIFFISIISIFIISCGNSENVKSKKAGDNTITIHELSDPDKINPITSTSASSTFIESNIFQTLLNQDPVTYEYGPGLAVGRPKITPIKSGKYKGGMKLDYELRKDAVWDNGSPITAYDYIFTIKAVKNPRVDAMQLRPYVEFIKEIVVDKSNPKKFTIFAGDTYIKTESASAFWVYPEYHYDKKKLMRKFTIQQLSDKKSIERLRDNKAIIDFANEFNSEKYQRESGYIVGSGPYRFKKWVTGQYIELEKKENWWGNNYDDMHNNPDKLLYKIIPDWTTAVAAMKDEGMDIAKGISSKQFTDLKENDLFNKFFTLHTPDFMAYDYIGMNMKSPIFKDKTTRTAMVYLIDKHEILDLLLYGMGKPTEGPFHPTKPYYNKDLKPREFDIVKAKSLLKQAGWKDSDQDGVLDKVIDGIKTPFEVSIKYNQGNDRKENICLMLKENAKKVGIEVDVQVREWTVYLEETKKHDFDMYIGTWVGSTANTDDPKQIWHTESYNGGSNYVGFGNAKTDAMIDKMRYEIDDAKRFEMYKDFQKILYDEVPYVFLNALSNRLAFHKRFNNANAFVVRPGYSEVEWTLNPIWGGGAQKNSKN